MDRAIDPANYDLWAQTQADWAWYRFASVTSLIRDEGGGALSASLARGLLEQAAYWDWAIATGIGKDYLVRQAAAEYDRLLQVAREIDDTTWIGWVLPPGSNLVASTTEGLPHHASEVVKRLGNGLAEPVLAALQFRGLFAANRLLDVLTHGNLAAALVMAPGGGQELSEALAAAIVHVAAAGATAVVLALLSPSIAVEQELTELAIGVARVAGEIHGLPLGIRSEARRPAKPRKGPLLDVQSDIERMPGAARSTTVAAQRFVQAAEQIAHLAVPHVQLDGGLVIAWAAFQLSWDQMMVFKGAISGQLGRALLPYSARSLLEDGARWEWVRIAASRQASGNALRALVADSKRHIDHVRNGLLSDGVPIAVVRRLLGSTVGMLDSGSNSYQLPPLSDMLSEAYPTASRVDSVRPMYSMLSQFVHATPLSALHLQRDVFPSLTAPTYAIAVEAACRGFWNISRTTLAMACSEDLDLSPQFDELAAALGAVIFETSRWHMLG